MNSMYWSKFNSLPDEEQLKLRNIPTEPGRYLARPDDDAGCPHFTHIVTVTGTAPWLKIKEEFQIGGALNSGGPDEVYDYFWGPKIEIPTPEFRLT